MRSIFAAVIVILICNTALANNIGLQKISLSDTNKTAKTVMVKMNLSWNNSWRDSINWDAAWIIMKFKGHTDSAYKWKPVKFSLTGNNVGTSSSPVKIVVPNDLMGAFVYRSTISEGNLSIQDISFLWNYGADGVTNIDSVEVKVFASEMVYIPEGPFAIGDGNGTNRSSSSFQLKHLPNSYAIINEGWSPLINTFSGNSGGNYGDDNIIYNTGLRISGKGGIDITGDKVAEYPNFPTGYRSFYVMKYELTQGQYADFLNTLSFTDNPFNQYYFQQNYPYYSKIPLQIKRVWANLMDHFDPAYQPLDYYRNTLRVDSVAAKVIVSRPDRAYGSLNQNNAWCYSDWAGLRMMSELEFEKAARGPLVPVYNEYAWGADSMYATNNGGGVFAGGTPLTISGLENGTEIFSDYNITRRYTNNFTGGDGGTGAYRVGIFANDTTSRVSSGSSYYGVMDLSKNSSELVISLGSSVGRGFSYLTHGIGKITIDSRGPSFYVEAGPMSNPTSSRNLSISQRYSYGDAGRNGFRAVRTAPQDN
jgi:formylglycine-generating enzyme required for sulfatase activity